MFVLLSPPCELLMDLSREKRSKRFLRPTSTGLNLPFKLLVSPDCHTSKLKQTFISIIVDIRQINFWRKRQILQEELISCFDVEYVKAQQLGTDVYKVYMYKYALHCVIRNASMPGISRESLESRDGNRILGMERLTWF